MIGKLVAYTFNRLKKEDTYYRTFVQKIVYFALGSEERKVFYFPYKYGPYSDDVQALLSFLEERPEIAEVWAKGIPKEYKERIDKILEFIKSKNLSPSKIALLSKIFFLKEEKGIIDINSLKEKSLSLGWKELEEENSNGIKKLFSLLEELQITLQR